MAKDMEKKDNKAVSKPKKESKFHPFKYLREMWGEVKKLTWLTRKELLNHTAVVFAFVILMAIVIYVLDLVFSSGMNLLTSIKIG